MSKKVFNDNGGEDDKFLAAPLFDEENQQRHYYKTAADRIRASLITTDNFRDDLSCSSIKSSLAITYKEAQKDKEDALAKAAKTA